MSITTKMYSMLTVLVIFVKIFAFNVIFNVMLTAIPHHKMLTIYYVIIISRASLRPKRNIPVFLYIMQHNMKNTLSDRPFEHAYTYFVPDGHSIEDQKLV